MAEDSKEKSMRLKANDLVKMMDMQKSAIKTIQWACGVCEDENLLDNVTADDLEQLKKYCNNLADVVNTSCRLSANILNAHRQEEETKKADEKKKEEKSKAKAKTKAKTETTEKEKPVDAHEEEAAGETEDLDFFDM